MRARRSATRSRSAGLGNAPLAFVQRRLGVQVGGKTAEGAAQLVDPRLQPGIPAARCFQRLAVVPDPGLQALQLLDALLQRIQTLGGHQRERIALLPEHQPERPGQCRDQRQHEQQGQHTGAATASAGCR
ncbi:MAG: hypothetical protein U5R48_05260 [Gammaproteobacteria bacterium]|nr:hypothetical protein [Gammaproteobacteria bacterium]